MWGMKNYCIYQVSPEGYIHSRCVDEVALSLHYGFKELGYDAPIVKSPDKITGVPIILGGNLLTPNDSLPQDAIIYQLEQIYPGSPWLTNTYVDILRRFKVWDYSRANIAALSAFGINASLCEIGYVPALTCIENNPEPDIDVIHIGALNPRRLKILNELSTKCKVVAVSNLYGVSRDALIARAKIILNLHFFEAKVFEIVRCSYMMTNRKCVVSETGADKQLEEPYADGVSFVPYNNLVDRCLYLLGNSEEREKIARRGFEVFSQRKQSDFLKAVL